MNNFILKDIHTFKIDNQIYTQNCYADIFCDICEKVKEEKEKNERDLQNRLEQLRLRSQERENELNTLIQESLSITNSLSPIDLNSDSNNSDSDSDPDSDSDYEEYEPNSLTSVKITLNKKEFDNLKRVNISISKCGICLDHFKDRDKAVYTHCKHKFHNNCIKKWLLEQSVYCPICRHDQRKSITNKTNNSISNNSISNNSISNNSISNNRNSHRTTIRTRRWNN